MLLRIILVLVLAVGLLGPADAGAAKVEKYSDPQGTLHIDNVNPEKKESGPQPQPGLPYSPGALPYHKEGLPYGKGTPRTRRPSQRPMWPGLQGGTPPAATPEAVAPQPPQPPPQAQPEQPPPQAQPEPQVQPEQPPPQEPPQEQ